MLPRFTAGGDDALLRTMLHRVGTPGGGEDVTGIPPGGIPEEGPEARRLPLDDIPSCNQDPLLGRQRIPGAKPACWLCGKILQAVTTEYGLP